MFFRLEQHAQAVLVRLVSEDGTNRLSRACVQALSDVLQQIRDERRPLVIAGNQRFFSSGADLRETVQLSASEAYQFSKMGQDLMDQLARFPARVCAAVEGYCMGGGLDLALACQVRIAAPHAIFAHRGAALGLITGWGGTQRLPRLIGKAKALELLLAAERIPASQALAIGLVDAVSPHPIQEALGWCQAAQTNSADKGEI